MLPHVHHSLTVAVDFAEWQRRFADVQGFLFDLEGYTLLQLAAHGEGDGAIVEIGSFMGRSTAFLAAGSASTGREKVYAVDHFKGSPEHQPGESYADPVLAAEGSTYRVFEENLKRLGLRDQVVPIRSTSAKAARNWRGPIRLLFIDGDHDYASVKRDYGAWSPFIVPGGYICFHDVELWPGVTRFFNELIESTPTLRVAFTAWSLKVVEKGHSS